MNENLLAWGSLLVLVLTILVGIRKKINLGILAMASAFLLGLLVSAGEGSMSSPVMKGVPITSLFPFSIVWMTTTVSILLNIGSANGTFDLVIRRLVRLARGRRALIPVYVFLIMFVTCAAGAGTVGVMVLLCTIAANIAEDQEIDPVFMLLSVLCGTTMAVGSPITTMGIICNSYSLELWGEKIAPGYLLPRGMLMAVLSFAVIYVIFRGWKLESRPVEKGEALPRLERKQILTLIGLGVFALLALAAGFDMVLSALLVAAALLLLGCADEKKVIAEVPWSSILMISGMCMLIGVVKAAGGMDQLTGFLSRFMNRWTVKPLYSLIGSLLSMVSSITGVVMPAMVPTIPAMAVKTEADPYAILSALAFGSQITCCSPVSVMGAVALGIMSGNSKWDANALFKKLLLMSLILMGTAALWAGLGLAG